MCYGARPASAIASPLVADDKARPSLTLPLPLQHNKAVRMENGDDRDTTKRARLAQNGRKSSASTRIYMEWKLIARSCQTLPLTILAWSMKYLRFKVFVKCA